MSETPASGGWIEAALTAYQGRLIRFAARYTGDLETARDVVQDTFLRLCREDPAKSRDHLGPWLFRVCRNRALDVRKKEGVRMPLDEPALAYHHRGGAHPGEAADPTASVEAAERSQSVLALLAELSPGQQEVLRLRFQEELSYKEISAVTSQSTGNVGFLIHSGLKRLRQRLEVGDPAREAEGGRSRA
jgi:RNA polymerase sigma-70 factor (ECF subfamily)